MKVYKPTPSMRNLQADLWTVEENNLDEMIQRANQRTNLRDHQRIVSESEDDDDSDEYGDEQDDKQSNQSPDESPEKIISHATSIHSEVRQ